MLPTLLRISLIVAVICYFVLVLIFLKNKALELKYTLLWLLSGVVMAVLIAFPRLLYIISNAFGIESGMNGLYIMLIGFILAILMSLTSIVSRQTGKIRRLVQENALLERRIRKLEENLDACGKEEDRNNISR